MSHICQSAHAVVSRRYASAELLSRGTMISDSCSKLVYPTQTIHIKRCLPPCGCPTSYPCHFHQSCPHNLQCPLLKQQDPRDQDGSSSYVSGKWCCYAGEERELNEIYCPSHS